MFKGDFFEDSLRKGANKPVSKEDDDEFSEDLNWEEPDLYPEELLFSEGEILTLLHKTHRCTPANSSCQCGLRNKVRGAVQAQCILQMAFL